MLICTKMIFSCLRKVLEFTKVPMSLGTVQGAAVSATFVAGFSLVSILQVGD